MWRSIAFCFALAFSVSVSAQPVTEAELAEHIGLLASDAYQGREPGTVGETQAAAYIAAQWSALGLKPSAAGGYWYQPVSLVDRVPGPAIEKFVDARGRMIDAEKDSIILRGIDQFGAVSNGQLIFIGFGEQADSQDMSGKIALMAIGASPTRKDAADYATRKARLIAAGASAVITMVDDGSWERRAAAYRNGAKTLAGAQYHAPIEGLVSEAAVTRLLAAAGVDIAILKEASQAADFGGIALPLYADLSVETQVSYVRSHNVIGKIAGARPDSGAVLFLGHWDHLGLCGPPDAADRICNGAVDNASGIALLIAVARRLAQQPQLDRDVYFLATTAEESGLLGARAFVADPPLKLSDIVAAFNADTVALNPDGATVSVIGRDGSAFDSEIAVVAAANGRTIDDSGTGDAYAARQDGAVLAAAGVPTRMITSAFADRFILDTFLNGRYHQADDDVEQGVELRGAAMDADFYVALGRHFGRLSSHPAKAP